MKNDFSCLSKLVYRTSYFFALNILCTSTNRNRKAEQNSFINHYFRKKIVDEFYSIVVLVRAYLMVISLSKHSLKVMVRTHSDCL